MQSLISRVRYRHHSLRTVATVARSADYTAAVPRRCRARGTAALLPRPWHRRALVMRSPVNLPIATDFAPMEAETLDAVPTGAGWAYEPKWDGFRCLAFRDGDEVELRSKADKPLGRYFPDVVAALSALGAQRFVLDGEIVIPHGDHLSFERLLMRIHPAASRVQKLAAETPALFVVFDMVLSNRGDPMVALPFAARRERLESFAERFFTDGVRLSPHTLDAAQAQHWLEGGRDGLDGVMAKRLDQPYRTGERAGMAKIKRLRTADCVVGGFRYASAGKVVGSLLLGLHDDAGVLHHVGYTSSFSGDARKALTPELEKLAGGAGFTGRAPGGQSRWSTRRTDEWVPLEPKLVAEVRYDHFSEGRFRHGTRFERWRPDKAPAQCTFAQIEREGRSTLALLDATDPG
ncbi:MAG TPA: ATP-dependent DNA ligase [Longimicrobiales bacterium]|nr:ATP-dependent DNA ligase [Longimicrobiales bacterium]